MSENPNISRRLFVLFLSLMVAFLLIGLRFFYLQVIDRHRYLERAYDQHYETKDLPSRRGRILDRKGRVLAIDSPSLSVSVNPKGFLGEDALKSIWLDVTQNTDSSLTSIPPIADLVKRAHSNKSFAWLARNLLPRDCKWLMSYVSERDRQKLPSPTLHPAIRRLNPYGEVAMPLIGFTGVDGQGLCGMEFLLDSELSTPPFRVKYLVDGLGKRLEREEFEERPNTHDSTLTIDILLQAYLEHYLAQETEVMLGKCDWVVAIVIRGRDNDVLALVSLPSYSIDYRTLSLQSRTKNYSAEIAFDPGPALNWILCAHLFADSTLHAYVELSSGSCLFLTDSGPSFSMLRERTSVVQKAGILTPAAVESRLHRLGFLERPRGGLPTVALPSHSVPASYTGTDATLANVLVSPLHLALVCARAANGLEEVLPTFNLLSETLLDSGHIPDSSYDASQASPGFLGSLHFRHLMFAGTGQIDSDYLPKTQTPVSWCVASIRDNDDPVTVLLAVCRPQPSGRSALAICRELLTAIDLYVQREEY